MRSWFVYPDRLQPGRWAWSASVKGGIKGGSGFWTRDAAERAARRHCR